MIWTVMSCRRVAARNSWRWVKAVSGDAFRENFRTLL
jgi:hypothetical protein